MDWLRLWHEMPTDPKWRVIARKTGQPVSAVIAVFNMILVNASTNPDERGILAGWIHEDVAAALDMQETDVAAIFEAMQGKVLRGNILTGWARRQPIREDDSLARVRKHRKKMKRSVTLSNASDSDSDSDSGEKAGQDAAGRLSDAVQAWNAMAAKAGVPPVKGLTTRRRQLFADRVAEHGSAAVLDAIEAVGQSEFCRGKNAREWRADFTFMLRSENFVKLIEGAFGTGAPAKPAHPPPREPETREELERAIEINLQYGNPRTVERYRQKLASLA